MKFLLVLCAAVIALVTAAPDETAFGHPPQEPATNETNEAHIPLRKGVSNCLHDDNKTMTIF